MSKLVRKISDMKTFISIFTLVFTLLAQAEGHQYKYSDLVIRDYDEMNHEVQVRIRNAHKATKGKEDGGEREAIEELRDALKLIFSRPNSDNMVSKLVPDVRRELSNFSAFEDTLSSLTAECLASVNDENAALSRRSTDLFVLENLLEEIRPEVASNEDLHRIVQRIADAKITVAHDVINDRKIRSMFKTKNPTEIAQDILKSLPKKDSKK